MGIDAIRQTEDGIAIQEVFDPSSLFQILIPFDDETSVCLRFIDPYGETIFNQIQIPILLKELQIAISNCRDERARKHGAKVMRLIQDSGRGPHVYIRFVGD